MRGGLAQPVGGGGVAELADHGGDEPGGGAEEGLDVLVAEGQVGEGEVPNKPADFKPEVKITMSKENMLKMFNRKLLRSQHEICLLVKALYLISWFYFFVILKILVFI